jgi:hypothetical protein
LEPSNSHVEVYLDLTVGLISCDPLRLTSPKSLSRDIETVTSRVNKEGLSFLTKTLPKLGKALDLGLSSTHFTLPREFKSSHGNRSIPAFMQAYFKHVFDANGDLLDGAEPQVVKHLRQVLYLLYKLELPYQASDEQRVVDSFVDSDKELELALGEEHVSTIEAASYITRGIFRSFDHKDILPRHGPGAVATGERLDQKWEFSRLYRSIHQVYPYYDYFMVGGSRELIDRLDWYKSLARLDHGCAKVVLVPKDSRGPRLISCEPLEFQWIQQGLGRKLVAHLESFRMTKGQINFTDQKINQSHALLSSQTKEYATIDLKDASDRVSLELVQKVFSKTPELLRALEACRTTSTKLPDGRVIPLNKFAPMGSALCFPVEAYVFWVIIVAAISREKRLQPELVGRRVFVYGDDIVIPSDWYESSTRALEWFALKVNYSKCCVKGPFRESCGVDAFKGVDVTPIRVKTRWTGRQSDSSSFASYTAFANLLFAKGGYDSVCKRVWGRVESVFGDLPFGTLNSSYPCKLVSDAEFAEALNLLGKFKRRLNKRFQRIEFQFLRLNPRKLTSKLDSWTRLIRDLLVPSIDDPQTMVSPRSIQLKRGWTPV